MHNIHELEQRWVKYKIKYFLPYIITTVFAIILTITLIFIFDTKNETTTLNRQTQEIKEIKPVANHTQTKKINKEEAVAEEAVVKKTIPKIESKPNKEQIARQIQTDETIKLTPSLDFMKKLRTDSFDSYLDEGSSANQNIQIDDQEQELVYDETIEDNEPVLTKPKISISTKETQNDIQHVIKRFKKNNNPALSLFVAKKYYKLGDYEKAYNYALITNGINNDIEQSWIIFAKSLVKLNKKELAMNTLKKYIRHSHSGNAKVLLDDIRSGKFR